MLMCTCSFKYEKDQIFSICIKYSDGHGKKNNSRPTTASGKNPQPTTV